MNTNDDIRPKYITLYHSYAIGSCVKSWPDLMTKQNRYTKHFHKTTITSSWTLSKTKISITIVKAEMPSHPNQKSRTRDNEEFMCCSEWIECLSWSYNEFFSSACLNFNIYHYSSHQQHCWRVTSLLFQCFGDLNINQTRLEQDPGLGGPVSGLRTVFIKFDITIFQFANWIQKN